MLNVIPTPHRLVFDYTFKKIVLCMVGLVYRYFTGFLPLMRIVSSAINFLHLEADVVAVASKQTASQLRHYRIVSNHSSTIYLRSASNSATYTTQRTLGGVSFTCRTRFYLPTLRC